MSSDGDRGCIDAACTACSDDSNVAADSAAVRSIASDDDRDIDAGSMQELTLDEFESLVAAQADSDVVDVFERARRRATSECLPADDEHSDAWTAQSLQLARDSMCTTVLGSRSAPPLTKSSSSGDLDAAFEVVETLSQQSATSDGFDRHIAVPTASEPVQTPVHHDGWCTQTEATNALVLDGSVSTTTAANATTTAASAVTRKQVTARDVIESVSSGILLAEDQLVLLLNEDAMDEILYEISVETVQDLALQLRALVVSEKSDASDRCSGDTSHTHTHDSRQLSAGWRGLLVSLCLAIKDAVENGRDELTGVLASVAVQHDAFDTDLSSSPAHTPLPSYHSAPISNDRVLAAKQNIQTVGRLLNQLLAVESMDVDAHLRSCLNRMEHAGIALSNGAVHALQRTGVIRAALAAADPHEIEQLYCALGDAMLTATNRTLAQLWLVLDDELAAIVASDANDVSAKNGDKSTVELLQQSASVLATPDAIASASTLCHRTEMRDATGEPENSATTDIVSEAPAGSYGDGAVAALHIGASVFLLADQFSSAAQATAHDKSLTHADETWHNTASIDVNAVAAPTTESIHQLSRIGANTVEWATALSLARFDLLRNYVQSIALLVDGLFDFDALDVPVMRFVHAVIGWIYRVLSLSFIAQIPDGVATIAIVAGAVVLTVGGFAWMVWGVFCTIPDPDVRVRMNGNAPTWTLYARSYAQRQRLQRFAYAQTGFLLLYFPITEFALRTVIAAAADGQNTPQAITCMMLLAGFTTFLPIYLASTININAPAAKAGGTFDTDGHPAQLSGHVFARLLARHPNHVHCPFATLYRGIEYHARHYKVYQMLLRVALLVPMLATSDLAVRNRALLALSTVAFAAFAAFRVRFSRVFVDPLSDRLELLSQCAAWCTALSAFLLNQWPSRAMQWTLGLVLTPLHLGVFALQVLGICLASPSLLLYIKNSVGVFTFSNTDRDIADALGSVIVPTWKLETECLHRIWQPFWRAVLLDQCGSEAMARLTTLEVAAMEHGRARLEQHFDVLKSSASVACRAVQSMLNGTIVCSTDDALRCINEDMRSCYFGQLVVQPFPFECRIIRNERFQLTELTIRDSAALVDLLRSSLRSDTTERLKRRTQLNALAAKGGRLVLPFSQVESIEVADGKIVTNNTRAVKCSKAQQCTVQFTCRYTMMTIDRGLRYQDGCGVVVVPHTGDVLHVTNRTACRSITHLGLTDDFDLVGSTWHDVVCASSANALVLRQAPLDALAERKASRQQWIDDWRAANAILSDAFWLKVYANPDISRAELETHLTEHESNSGLQMLPTSHKTELDVLFWRMHFVQSHPARRAWFVFWADFFARNGAMHVMKKHVQDFDPALATSICYRVMCRSELEKWLSARQLIRRSFSLRHPLGGGVLFSVTLLDCLYTSMGIRARRVHRQAQFRRVIPEVDLHASSDAARMNKG